MRLLVQAVPEAVTPVLQVARYARLVRRGRQLVAAALGAVIERGQ